MISRVFELFTEKKYLLLKSLVTVFFILTVSFNLFFRGEQQFSYLAASFLKLKLYFIDMPGNWGDTVYFNGQHYWHQGLLPAAILMPFVAIFGLFGGFFYQGYLQIFLVLLIFILNYRLARVKKISSFNAWLLAFAFCFSSTFIGIGLWSWSWYFAQVVSTLLWFLTFLEYSSKRRFAIIGVLLGLIFLTRSQVALGIVFFIGILLVESKNKIRSLLELISPFLFTVFISFWYNYVRFNNILESGYNTNQVLPLWLNLRQKYGAFNIVYIPQNFFYYFVEGPLFLNKFPFIEGNDWGMSLFINSPYLIWLWQLRRYFDFEAKLLLVTAILILTPALMFYSSGYRQFGSRYTLDFLPLLQFLLIKVIGERGIELPNWFFPLVIVSACFNFYLFFMQIIQI